MESQFSCAALPGLRSGQSSRRPPPRRGSTRSAAASPLHLLLACEERRGTSDHCGRRSRAHQRRFRRKRRIFRWSAKSCGGPPGLGGDVFQFPMYTQPDLDYDIDPEYTPWCTQFVTLVTSTCLETVVPVNGGTFAMTISRNPATAHVLERHPWTTKLAQSTILGTRRLTLLSARHVSVSSRRSSGVLTNTCSRSVAPVNGGTRAMTIFRILYPWTTKRERAPLHAHRDLSGKNAHVNSKGHRGAPIENSRAVSPANGGTRATMKVHSRLERNVRNPVVCSLRRQRQLLHLHLLCRLPLPHSRKSLRRVLRTWRV